MKTMKIYGVCDSGYMTPFIQEVEAVKAKNGKSYSVPSRPVSFNCRVQVRAEDAALSPKEAQEKWASDLLKQAERLEERARDLRERAQLTLDVVPCK